MTKEETRAYNKAYYLANKEKIKAQVKNYKVRTGYKYQLSERQKEEANERARRWYQANKQLMIDRAKEWKKNNKEKVQINTRSYASRRKYANGSYSTKDYLRLKSRLNNMCGYCNEAEADTIDHIIPLSRGGSNYIGNIMPACGKCNYSKQCKTIVEWRSNKPVCTRTVALI